MKKALSILLATFFFVSTTCFADRAKDVSRLQSAGSILDESMAAPDKGIPSQIIGSAECVAVIPSLLKAGFVFGGAYGKGVATCRTSTGWSAPAFFRLEGGSFGLQIGGQAVDLIMLIMNQRGMEALLSSHFKLGADASAAAGPVGRDAEGMTDWKMRAEVLTYSRARGAFAGVTVNGAVISQDKADTRDFYGRMIPFKTILTGGVAAPSESQPFLSAVTKYNAQSKTNTNTAATPAPAPPASTATPAASQTTSPSSPSSPASGNAASAPTPAPTQPQQTTQPQPTAQPQEKPSPATPSAPPQNSSDPK
jgi:lipid-binding SYLF domain-containing protein